MLKRITAHLMGFYCLFYTFMVTAGSANLVFHLGFLVVLLALVVFYYRYDRKVKFSTDGFKDIYVAIVVALGYALLTFAWSPDSNLSIAGIVPWIAGWSIAVMQLNAVNDEKDFNIVITDLHIYFIILMVIGWIEMETGEYSFSTNPEHMAHMNDFLKHYPVAGFFNTNNYAYILSVLFPFMLYDLFMGRLKKLPIKYVLLIVETLSFFWLLVNTSSRLSIIALVVFVVFLIMYNMQNLKKSKLPIFIFVFFIAIVIYFMVSGEDNNANLSLSEYFSNQVENTLHPVTDSDENRFKLVEGGIRIFLDNPIGVGVGVSHKYTNDYIDGMRANMPIHNMIIIILAELGIVGGIAFLYVLVRTIYKLWKVRLKNTDVNLKAGFILASLLNAMLMSMCPSNATSYPFSFMIFGVWLAFYKIFRSVPTELSVVSKKDTEGSRANIVGFYDKEAAMRDREEYKRKKALGRLGTEKAEKTGTIVSEHDTGYVKPILEDDNEQS